MMANKYSMKISTIDLLVKEVKNRSQIDKDEGLKVAQEFAQEHACDCGTPTFIEEAQEVILLGTFAGAKLGYVYRAVHNKKHFAMVMDCENAEIIHWKEILQNQRLDSVEPPVSHQKVISISNLRELQRRSSNELNPLKMLKSKISKLLKGRE